MDRLLKFRYFLAFIILLGCGDGSGKKVEGKQEENPISEPAKDESPSTGSILFFGDSLTAGLGLDPNQAFPALIQQRLDSLGYAYEVINAGLSGETTASGRNRLDWVLGQQVEIFVLELGANDGLRGIPLSETRKNLEEMILMVRDKYPRAKIVLAGMQLPPNMGPEYTAEFRKIFPELAVEQGISLVPFLLEGVGGIPELNQDDGIHPTEEGHKIVAETVWKVLAPLVEELQAI
jgi:acyl-CoA thioesterase-1